MSEFVSGARNSLAFWENKSFVSKRSAQPFSDSDYLIASLSWSTTNSKLAVVPQWGHKVAICDLQDEILTWSFLTHREGKEFTCGCLMSNSRYLLTGCSNSTVVLWDIKNRSINKTLEGHSAPVMCVAHNAADSVAVSGSQDGCLLLHSLTSTPSPITNLTRDTPLTKAINRVRFSHFEKAIVGSVCEDGSVCLWSVESQRLLTKMTPSHLGAATDLCFSPSNNLLMASVGTDGKIRCYDIQQRKPVTQISAPVVLSSVTILKDASTLIGGGADGKLYVYELRFVKTPRHVVEAHRDSITCIAEQWSHKSSGHRGSMKGSSSRGPTPRQSPRKSSRKPSSDPPDLISREVFPHRHGPGDVAAGSSVNTDVPPSLITASRMQTGVAGLTVHTPFVGGIGKEQRDVGALSYSTPAPSLFPTDTSGIFSPLDAHLTTPLPGGRHALHTVTPTTLPTTTPTTLPTTTSTILPTAPSILPTAPPIEAHHLLKGFQMMTPSQPPSGTSGIFSPLEGVSTGTLHSTQATPPSIVTTLPSHLHTVTTSPPTVSESQGSEIQPSEAEGRRDSGTKTDVPVTSTLPNSGLSATATTVQASIPNSTPLTTKSPGEIKTDGKGAAPRPVATPPHNQLKVGVPLPGIQVEYFEQFMRSFHEDLWYDIHRDFWGLAVDMFRQFFITQEQIATSFAALNDKVDRLTQRVEHLEEEVHQCMPKH